MLVFSPILMNFDRTRSCKTKMNKTIMMIGGGIIALGILATIGYFVILPMFDKPAAPQPNLSASSSWDDVPIDSFPSDVGGDNVIDLWDGGDGLIGGDMPSLNYEDFSEEQINRIMNNEATLEEIYAEIQSGYTTAYDSTLDNSLPYDEELDIWGTSSDPFESSTLDSTILAVGGENPTTGSLAGPDGTNWASGTGDDVTYGVSGDSSLDPVGGIQWGNPDTQTGVETQTIPPTTTTKPPAVVPPKTYDGSNDIEYVVIGVLTVSLLGFIYVRRKLHE